MPIVQGEEISRLEPFGSARPFDGEVLAGMKAVGQADHAGPETVLLCFLFAKAPRERVTPHPIVELYPACNAAEAGPAHITKGSNESRWSTLLLRGLAQPTWSIALGGCLLGCCVRLVRTCYVGPPVNPLSTTGDFADLAGRAAQRVVTTSRRPVN